MSRSAVHARQHECVAEIHWGVGRAGHDAAGGVGGGAGEVGEWGKEESVGEGTTALVVRE